MGVAKKLISMDESIARELEIISKALNKSQKEIVESALDFYFDYTDGIIADKITQDIIDGTIKVYDNKEVYDELGIDVEEIEG
ncbi:hypothetical protein LF845_10845 [Deferribacterales bacterium Es71-Z0220]|jgi:predicted FMN-binding regulatory protein PaiB|uniref:hypothetical protein n=1 Tax=Deferrivibrio essentukiensis TaxID=2880922 RepID=UPI001F6011F6|nr:hypothetical protein [Deferrivibrio essentukiensis]MCB4205451.1 hypothetical protein [Deferrivibrio essentukiensis]